MRECSWHFILAEIQLPWEIDPVSSSRHFGSSPKLLEEAILLPQNITSKPENGIKWNMESSAYTMHNIHAHLLLAQFRIFRRQISVFVKSNKTPVKCIIGPKLERLVGMHPLCSLSSSMVNMLQVIQPLVLYRRCG